jgi:hypothetical protein
VGSLRDHVSFTRFYMLLVPLGLLLARHQLRERTLATALVAGSTALLLSLYFSRVVHPNYLILAATLLPVAALMRARVPADVVVVPLLLLMAAVEIAQAGVMQAAWGDALAARLPEHVDGVWRALAPRAVPDLTLDPLGLLWSALAAGLGIVMVTAGVLQAGTRVRVALMGLAAVVVVVAPTLVAIRVAEASGIYRVQDRWALAWRSQDAPGTAREAWSTSFRRDPPAILEHATPSTFARFREPRLAALAAIAIVAALLFAHVAPALRPLAIGIGLLAPPIVVGTAFGSGAGVVLAVLAGAWWFARRDLRMAALAAIAVALVAGGPGMVRSVADSGWVNLALYVAGTGAGFWLAAVIGAAVRADSADPEKL